MFRSVDISSLDTKKGKSNLDLPIRTPRPECRLMAELGPKARCRSSAPANAPLRLPPSTTRWPRIFLLVTRDRVAGPEVHRGLLDVKGVVG